MPTSMRNWFAKSWSWAKVRSILLPPPSDSETVFSRREKVMVSMVAYGLAMILWLMVNMDREFTISVAIPVVLGELTADKSLTQSIPDRIDATITGPGWKLMGFQNNLPVLVLDVMQEQVDVLARLRELTDAADGITVVRAQPFFLNVRLDETVMRRVPVIHQLDIRYRNRYDQVGEVRLTPDSITVTGARSVLDTIRSWTTVSREITNVRDSLELTLPVTPPPSYVQVSHAAVRVEVGVTEFTEGEVRIPIRTRGNPRGQEVVFSPATLTVRYDVPIDEYTRSQTQTLFAAYVPYGIMVRDSTGFVVPQVERTESVTNVRIRSVQPRTVAYYIVSE